MDGRPFIFLSYRSTEADFALQLAADLKNAGVNLWMDRMDIRPGEDWVKALEWGVNNCSAMIAVISAQYVRSNYCLRELARADRLGRTIYPVLLTHPPEEEMPIILERRQHVDFTGWQDQASYTSSLKRLVDVLGDEGGDRAGALPNAEARYLTLLIADLERRRALHEYADLEIDDTTLHPRTLAQDLWHQTSASLSARRGGKREVRPLKDISQATERLARFMLIGDGSTGKTDIMLRLALEAAHHRRRSPDRNPLPVVVWLADWPQDQTFLRFIASHVPANLRQFSNQQIAFFLDDLDRGIHGKPERLAEVRAWLMSSQTPRQVIITTRRGTDGIGSLNLPHVIIEPLSEAAIVHFIDTYLSNVAAAAFSERLLPRTEIDRADPHHLFNLARKPFYLLPLIAIYKEAEGQYPLTSGHILERLVRQIWGWMGLRMQPHWPAHEIMAAAFSDLALHLVESGETDTDLQQAVAQLEDPDLLEAGRIAYLLDVRGGRVSFYHPLLRAFFAARQLAPNALPDRALPPGFTRAGGRIDGEWDAILPIALSLCNEPEPIIYALAEVNPILAMEAVLAGTPVASSTFDIIVERLEALAEERPEARLEVARLLLRVNWHDRALPLLLHVLRRADWPQREAAAAMMPQVQVRPLPGLLTTLRADEPLEDGDISSAISVIGDSVWPVLYTALAQEPRSVKTRVARLMGETMDRAAVPGLVNLLADESNLLRREVIIALGTIADPDVLRLLFERLRQGSPRVQLAASDALAQFSAFSIEGLAQELNNPDAEVRRLSVRALGYIGGQNVIEPLRRAIQDPDVDVRAEVLRAVRRARLADDFVQELIGCLNQTEQPRWGKKRICDLARALLTTAQDPAARLAVQHFSPDQAIESLPPASSTADSEAAAMPPRSRKASSTSAGVAASRLRDDKLSQATARQVARLQGRMKAPEWETRRAAVEELAQLGDPGLPVLLKHIRDDDEQVRLAIAQALGKLHSKAAIKGLLAMLHDDEAMVVDTVSDLLAGIGNQVIPGLLHVLNSDNLNARSAAIEALGKIGDPMAVPYLARNLRDERAPWMGEPIHDVAERALRQIGTQDALKALGDTIPEAMRHAAAPEHSNGSSRLKQERAMLPRLVTAVKQSSETEREMAAKTLRDFAKEMKGRYDDATIQPLIDTLGHPDWFVRWAMIEALGWINAPGTVTALIDALQDDAWTVRLAIIRALVEIRDPQAVPYLVRLLGDDHAQVREVAAEALGELQDRAAVPGLLQALEDADSFVRRSAAEALGRVGDQRAVSALTRALDDSSVDVRWAAVLALKALKSTEAVAYLKLFLSDRSMPQWEDRRICDVVAEALQAINTDEARAAVAAWRDAEQSTQ